MDTERNLQIITIHSEEGLTTTSPDMYLALANLICNKIITMHRQEYSLFNTYCQTVKTFADKIIQLVQELNELMTENLESECNKKIKIFTVISWSRTSKTS